MFEKGSNGVEHWYDVRHALTAMGAAAVGPLLATAPKSNRTAMALWRAQADVRDLPAGEVPTHLRDAHYRAAAGLGHGVGYAYPHDDPTGWVPQDYRPAEVEGRVYYEPSAHGAEARLGSPDRGTRASGEGSVSSPNPGREEQPG